MKLGHQWKKTWFESWKVVIYGQLRKGFLPRDASLSLDCRSMALWTFFFLRKEVVKYLLESFGGFVVGRWKWGDTWTLGQSRCHGVRKIETTHHFTQICPIACRLLGRHSDGSWNTCSPKLSVLSCSDEPPKVEARHVSDDVQTTKKPLFIIIFSTLCFTPV